MIQLGLLYVIALKLRMPSGHAALTQRRIIFLSNYLATKLTLVRKSK